jgi:acetylornithine deacetylase
VTVPYCSDASAYRSDTVKNILVMGPGSIDQAHGAEEWVEISELERMAGVYRQWWMA